MRLLITADLHFRFHWFRWLIGQAPDFDLICIAGDPLDTRSWRLGLTTISARSMRGEFLGKFLEVSEHYAELVHNITDACEVEVSGDSFTR
jgi:hypothetical protein